MRWSVEQLEEYLRRRDGPAPLPVIDDGMNKTEAAYAQVLEIRKRADEVVSYEFERIKLKLATRTFYTPDFFVTLPTHFEVHEVKGFWRDDARVKFKVAAEQFPYFRFLAVTKAKREWRYEEI